MPSTYDTVCTVSGGGVASADSAGCSGHLTVEGALQQAVDAYLLQMAQARDAYLSNGENFFAEGVPTPNQYAATLPGTAQAFAQMYPGSAPTGDVSALVNQYQQMIIQGAATYGIPADGGYSSNLDVNWGDLIFPADVTPTPLVPSTNVVSYNPGTGFQPTLGSMPTESTPTIPAYTSGSNAAATQSGSPVAAAGGSSSVGTAAGAGPTQGGTLGNTLSQGGVTGVPATNTPAPNNMLWIILAALAAAVFIFGRK